MSQLGPEARDQLRHQNVELSITLDHALAVRLRKAAAARDMPLARLAHDVLTVLGEEPTLITAVLDDDGP
jgi:hypothetical protein